MDVIVPSRGRASNLELSSHWDTIVTLGIADPKCGNPLSLCKNAVETDP